MITTIVCGICSKEFTKPSREHRRSIKLGRAEYCSRSCSGKARLEHLNKMRSMSTNDISKSAGNRKDKYTGLREFIRRAKSHGKEITLSLEDLYQLWSNSNVCAYSGVQLILPSYTKHNNPITTASLDRINSSKPYEEGNVQFVSIAMNHMKGNMTHEETLELIQLIRA